MTNVTTQDAFHPMKGHVNHGQIVIMNNGDRLEIVNTIRGWSIYNGDYPEAVNLSSAYEVADFIVSY